MKTILLITARFDPAADLLLAELRRRTVPCVRWNTYEFPLESVLTYRASDAGFATEIITDGRTIALNTLGSVWWQWDQPAGFPISLSAGERRFAETEAQLALAALTTVSDLVWINHPVHERRAKSKPAQLFMARRVGLDIPQTVVTNDPDEVRRFIANLPSQTVYKGLSQPRDMEPGKALFTGLVTDEMLANIDVIRLTPGVFQERIDKSYEVRVTVVGSRIFSVKIDSQKHAEAQLDWRRALHDVAYEAINLPCEIEAKIQAFMAAFGLVYGAFDFIVTPQGRYVFLEINPSGQYMWLECATGLGITAALADALIEPCQAHPRAAPIFGTVDQQSV
jgi:glutathione synthase/RimK-type ligase-like ATP-grasp enzyme